MSPRGLSFCESCVLDWKCFSETLPGARLHMPSGDLLLLSSNVLTAALSGSTHSMKKQIVDIFSTSEYLCLSQGLSTVLICIFYCKSRASLY